MKQMIRNQIRTLLKANDVSQDAPSQLVRHLSTLLDSASAIAIYHATNYELSLNNVIEYSLLHGKQLFQPLCYKHSRRMWLVEYDAEKRNIFAGDDVIPHNSYEWYNLDLILLPLLAVDVSGVRLGKGGGYYDATLADVVIQPKRPILCGVGFDMQLIEHVPRNDWDIKLDYFVSEQQLIKF